jgi:hypothetical protein
VAHEPLICTKGFDPWVRKRRVWTPGTERPSAREQSLAAWIESFGFSLIVKTIAIELTFASFGFSDWTGQAVRSNKCQARSGQWQHHNIL